MRDAGTPVIVARALEFSYPGGTVPAVDGVDFQVNEGEIFGFLGPSGAGKSTTQKILIGLLRDYRGSVTVRGKALRDWGPDYYERIGVAFEQPNHYLKLTALENLTYFASLYRGATEQPTHLLDRLGLAEQAEIRVAQFSKGMRVRLNLARALLNKPTLLFLDEPTAGLDPVNARRVRDLVAERRAAGATVFLTTHDMWAADRLCDRVAFIVDGKIRLIDSPRRLKLRHGSRTVRIEYEAEGATETPGYEDREFELDGLADQPEFLALLRGGRIQTIHTLEATLEKIFIDVTGRPLR